jgi:NhaA family Na+:H+ antiporter
MKTDNDRGVASVASLKFIEAFLRVETASGLLLLCATVTALVWANSPWSKSYEAVWHAPSVHFVVNDLLMTVFFLVVGLEIRRETQDGALSRPRLAALPIAAAIGGIVAPAAIYFLVTAGHPGLRAGWAIPTATDIAFAVGALALLGNRIDPALRVLLLALAIADDVAAILVVAFFYADGIAGPGIAISAAAVACVVILRRLEVTRASPYVFLGAVLWFGLLRAGLHPVLAGVILGLLTPTKLANGMEAALHAWVAYGVMPLFALANAGISFMGMKLDAASAALFLAIVAALVVGKPLGIVAATAIAVQLRLCQLPVGVNWAGVALIGCLGGIGFTMSIFIGTLAFSDPALLAAAKFGVLVASILAGTAALVIGRTVSLRAHASRLKTAET